MSKGWRRFAIIWTTAAVVVILGWCALTIAQAAGVVRYGSPVCGPNEWVQLQTAPRMAVHDAPGACVTAPGKTRAAMTVDTSAGGGFPNISDGIELGHDSCPSAADMREGLCDRYPVALGREGEPYATVKATLAGGYAGNVAFDDWYSPSSARTSYADRCSAHLGDDYVEVMVWLAHPGDYPGTARDYTTWLDGRRWRELSWETSTGCPRGEGWRLVIFEAPRVSDGVVVVHHLKLNVFSGYAIREGWMGGSQYLTAIDLGFEIHAGGAGNAIDSYSLTGGAR